MAQQHLQVALLVARHDEAWEHPEHSVLLAHHQPYELVLRRRLVHLEIQLQE